MKSIILNLSLFVFLISIQSCSIQKRVHLPGYHVEWNQSKSKKKVKGGTESNDSELAVKPQIKKELTENKENLIELINQKVDLKVTEKSLKKEITNQSSNTSKKSIKKNKKVKLDKSNTLIKLKSKTFESKIQKVASDGSGSSALNAIGWVFIIIGIIILLLLSLVLGIVLMLLGLLFVIAGRV